MTTQLLQGDAFHQALDAGPFLTKTELAGLFQCTTRHVADLEKEGRIPQGVRLGACVRWPRKVIDKWINEGCPTITT